MVTCAGTPPATPPRVVGEIRRVAGAVADPEIPALTVEDLGILRDVRIDAAGHVDVDITPTYSGCPALDVMRAEIEQRIAGSGYPDVSVHVVLSPAWTTEWMSDEARKKLREHGIAPPRPGAADMRMLQLAVACPVCDSPHTAEVARFGSTPCQALRRCSGCSEPFPHFKEH
jgi:ring-1,2-phenylacetyl-CoA epoxidase subunit PaaD